jgi:hypothetical protein
MKKVLVLFVMIGSVLTSCKKDHVCSCEVFGTTNSIIIQDATLSEAEDVCAIESDGIEEFGGSCQLD